jgi:hypothetical protein
MARYFLHLKNSVDEVLDQEGTELSEDAVRRLALRSARECIAEDVKAGRIDLHYRIEVFNESEELVHTLQFRDAAEMVPAHVMPL